MPMDDRLLARFNDQIALEQASARAYLQMAIWAESRDYGGAATWFRGQATEESQHADTFIEFVLDRDGDVVLQALDAPRATFDDLVEVFATALEHESRVSTAIGELYAAANEVGDYQSLPLLSRFLTEQVEEEASVRTILGELRMVAGDPSALLMLDRELPGRRGGGQTSET